MLRKLLQRSSSSRQTCLTSSWNATTSVHACMPHLPRFSTGFDPAHLHAPSSTDIVNSIDSNDVVGLAYPASQATLLGQTFMSTGSEDDLSAWQPDPIAFASWSQKVISHEPKFKAVCQVSKCFAVLAHPAIAGAVVSGLVT